MHAYFKWFVAILFFQQIDITLKKNKKAKNSEILSPECFVKTAC